MADPHNLARFVQAQAGSYDTALAEMRAGAKRSHWMWFVFPQFAGLGRSPMAQAYAIASLDEARAYFAHPLLGIRLRESAAAMSGWAGKRSAAAIMGDVDAVKLRSSLTLFEAAGGEPVFGQVIDALFDGERDARTLALIEAGS